MGLYRKALWNTKRPNYTVLELYTVNSLIRPGGVRREVGGGSDGGGGGSVRRLTSMAPQRRAY